MLLLLLLLSVDLAPSGTRLNTGDSFKSKTDVDNKRHTSAHQPLTSHSPMGVSIPPSPPVLWFSGTNLISGTAEFINRFYSGDDTARESRSPTVSVRLTAILLDRLILRRGNGSFEEALSLLEQSQEVLGRSAATSYNLGLCLQGVGRPSEALALVIESCQLDPSFEPARLMRHKTEGEQSTT